MISELASALIKIAKVGNLKGLNSSLNTLKKMPKTMNNAASAMNGYAQSAASASPATERLASTLTSLKVKFAAITFIAHKVFSAVSGWVNSSNSYVENVNLFTVAMGEYADEAMEYAETVHDALGIDLSEFIRNQGVFMSMAKGFGLATDAAYEMSKGLTELSYDLASFYNISLDATGDGAFAKVQSGIAGELEPLRRLGFALSEASLQQVAYNHGINLSVREMTEAQKATLRYTAMVEQAADMGVIGDMSRTVTSSANAIRILKQQLAELGRTLGSVVIPILMEVLPYLQAFVRVLTNAAKSAANLVGFTLPTIDYSDVGGLGDEFENAAENAKELKAQMMGIDELNVISQNDSENSTGGNSYGSDLGIDVESIWDKSLFANMQTQVDELVPKMEKLWEVAKLVGAVVISWKVASEVHSFFKMFTDEKLSFAKTAGLAISLTGLTLTFSGSYDIGKGDANVMSVLKTAIGSALSVGGALLTFGTGPVGWAIGIGAALAVSITGISLGMSEKSKQEMQQELEDRFGELELSAAEISEYVAGLTTSKVTMKIDLYVDQNAVVEQAKGRLASALANLKTLNVKAELGLNVSKETYDQAVEELIKSSNEYFESKIISYTLSVEVLLDGTTSGANLSEFATDFLISNQAKLNGLGEDLKSVVSRGFVDGEWIPDKLKEAIKLQEEIQQVLSYVSDTEFKAKMKALELDTGNTKITLKSYKEVRKEAEAIISEQLSNLEEIRLENLQLAQMQFDQNILNGMSEAEAKKIYDQVVADIDAKFREESATIEMGAVTFSFDTVLGAFSDEVDKAAPILNKTVDDMLNDGFYYGALQWTENPYDLGAAVVEEVKFQLTNELGMLDMSKATEDAMKELYTALKPDIAEMEKLAKSYKEAGQAVPEEISKGLTDAHTLGAMLGDLDSINYLVGERLSTSPEYLESLGKAKDAGEFIDKSIAEGLVNNIELVTNEATGTVTAIKNTMTGEITTMTPILKENLKAMGINITEGLYNGADSSMTGSVGKWKEWAYRPWEWFKEFNAIHSPSKLFEQGGEYLSAGLYNGVSGSLKKEKFVGVFDRIKEAFATTWSSLTSWFTNNVKPKFTAKSWSEIFSGVKDGFVQSIKGALNTGIDKFNEFIGWINDKLSFTIPGFTIFEGAEFKNPITGNTVSVGSIGWGSKNVELLSIPQVMQRYADGGFIEDGVFTMNQGEIAGRFNNGKSVVANNEQIIAGISEGVYSAVVAALGNGGNKESQSINVYLDGKQIYSSVKKTESERGKQIFGNQLGYGY